MRTWRAAVQPVQGGDLACLRQGRIVEDGVAQILDRSAVVDEDLADVDELRRALPEHVDPEELARLPVEQKMATVRPIFAAAIAALWPAGPLPMTTRS